MKKIVCVKVKDQKSIIWNAVKGQKNIIWNAVKGQKNNDVTQILSVSKFR